MGDKDQLGFLVKLIDDDTEEVRTEILKELSNYGSALEEDLKEFSDILNPQKLDLIKPILDTNRKQWLLNSWSSWFNITNEYIKLEHAINLIAQYQSGINYNPSLSKFLNKLTDEFRIQYPYGTELDLSEFLFVVKGFHGDQKDYYNPMNSNLIYVIENKKGIPISLTILFMLIGSRLGFKIEGCNFPGHFLSKIVLGDEIILIDCFNDGKLIHEKDIKSLASGSYDTIIKLVELKTNTKTIIRRVINNLTNAYRNINDVSQSDFFLELLSKTPL